MPADPAYLQLAEKLCRQTGARLIIDEIQTGMGRTGRFLAYEHVQIKPDIITMAKGLAGGVPIGAMIANQETATGFHTGDHGTTFGGNPLACSAALAVLDEFESADLVANAARTGEKLQKMLRRLAEHQPLIKEVRGRGLMIGVELASPLAVAVKLDLLAAGYLVGSVGDCIIRLLPPLILDQKELPPFCEAFERTLKEAAAK